MKIEKTELATHTTLALKGDFETDDAAMLLQTIDELRAKGVRRIAANLRKVKYLNSTALGTMIKARQTLRDESGEFIIVKPSPTSREIICKMGIDSVVPMFDDEQDADRFLTEGQTATVSAEAHKGVGDDKLGPTIVMFSFSDDRANLFKGRTHRGVGTIETVDSEGMVFLWDHSRHDLEPDKVSAMFAPGSTVQTKFQIKLVRKDYFQIKARIERSATGSDGTAMVKTTWTGITETDRSALARFTDDMAYLKRQVSGDATA